jgi:hypothetical protein
MHASGVISLDLTGARRTLPTNARRYRMPDGRVTQCWRTNASPTRGYGRCGYCGHSWDQVESFSFTDHESGSGFFPTCIGCWLEIRSFNDRQAMRLILSSLLDMWRNQGDSKYTIEELERVIEPYWETA